MILIYNHVIFPIRNTIDDNYILKVIYSDLLIIY